jgi:hypothetical protein
MRRILTSEFVQNNNNASSGLTLLKKKRDGFKSTKKWRDDFATVKRQKKTKKVMEGRNDDRNEDQRTQY